MKFKLVLVFCLIFVSSTILSQSLKSTLRRYNDLSIKEVKHFSDTLAHEAIICDSLVIPEESPNPYLFRLFAPLTYYYGPINRALSLIERDPKPDILSLMPNSWWRKNDSINQFIDKSLLYAYLNNPIQVRNTERNIMNRSHFRENIIKDAKEVKVVDLAKKHIPSSTTLKEDIIVRRPNFWKKSGSASLQFSQNYISSNWYKGGESTNTLLSSLTFESNYNDEQKVQWDNKLELKLGFLSARSDTLHKVKTNNDLIRMTSKLGFRAVSTWYYTFQAEFNSQFFEGYKSNDPKMYSNIFAPANLIFSVGMDYKKMNKILTASVYLSPGAYNLRYVGDRRVDETQFGLKSGHDFLNDIGSKIEVNTKWTIIDNVTWQSRFYYFTNYKKVEAEWENTVNLAVSRSISTQLFFHGRFDDSVIRTSGFGYFQLKELLSVGLNYTW